MDNRCLGDVCKSLETQSPEKAAECVKTRTAKDDDIDGCKSTLRFMLCQHCVVLTGLSLGVSELPGSAGMKI